MLQVFDSSGRASQLHTLRNCSAQLDVNKSNQSVLVELPCHELQIVWQAKRSRLLKHDMRRKGLFNSFEPVARRPASTERS